MKKNFGPIITALALSLSWLGCNKSGKLNQASTFTTPSGPVELKLKWPQGERIVQVLDLKQNMEFNIPGQPAPMKQEMTMGQAYGLTVVQATPDGGHEVEMDFNSARMGMKMGDKTLIEFDSEKKTTANKPNPVADMFQKIVGSKIEFFLDASNEVQRIEGVDALVNNLTSGAKPDASAQLKSMFSESYFKQMMSANRFLPPHAVQPGDTWPVQLEYPMGAMGTMLLNYDVTFQSWEMHGKRNCARLEFRGTMTTKPEAETKSGAMSISIPDGNSTGVSWFDPELGITIDTHMNQDMQMVIHMPPNARTAAAHMQEITNQMTQDLTIKLESVK